MSAPLVSVVIPSYNYGHFVVEAVESVLAQTYPAVEVLVIDDGSTDDTRERLAPYTDRIRYLPQANQGLSAARNAGIRAARGEFIALLDADDLWHPDKLRLQVEYCQQHPEVALLGTDTVNTLPEKWPVITEPPAVRLSFAELVLRSRFAPSTALIRTSVFEEVGFFDSSLRSAEDWDLWIRIGARRPVAKLVAPLTFYRLHVGGMSTHAERMEQNEWRVLERTFATYGSQCPWWLRRKTLGYAAHNSAFRYALGRRWGTALRRMLESFRQWPLPFRSGDTEAPLARPRRLAVLLLRMLRLKAPDPLAPPTRP